MNIPRYLEWPAAFRAASLDCDVLVLGSGIAGLCAALAAAEKSRVLLICKGGLHDSNTFYAQGGIAAPTPDPQDADAHIADTLRVACGLADRAVVERIIRAAPAAIEQLIQWGVAFDRTGGVLSRTREGGHSRSRVLHARGDATGLELSAVLADQVRASSNIRVMEHHFAVDLLTNEGRCEGVIVLAPNDSAIRILSGTTVLATGGAGEVFQYTTNPAGATADGAAMALRAGVVLRDMEFMQFHPTALHVGAEPLPLVSEALRGEGARLVDGAGRRFMAAYHSDGELAPRDVVSRAIFTELARSGDANVYLDVRHWTTGFMAGRFPSILQSCLGHGITPDTQLIPVRPAAHYMIGGVNVDSEGRSSLPGLYACGEAAGSGMHGANRLASNSLLEALVLGDACGRTASAESRPLKNVDRPSGLNFSGSASDAGQETRVMSIRAKVRRAMWDHVGIVRSRAGLDQMDGILQESMSALCDMSPTQPMMETVNIITTAAAMAAAALARTESRGVHFRKDFAAANDADWLRHVEVSCSDRALHVDLDAHSV